MSCMPEGVPSPEQEQGDGQVGGVDNVILQRAQHDDRDEHHVRVVPDQVAE